MFVAAVLAGIILGLLIARPAKTQAPTIENQDYKSDDITITQNAIQTPGTVLESNTPVLPERSKPIATKKAVSNGHSARAEKQISATALREFLLQRKSPLAEYSDLLLASPYYSTIIGICTIEQYSCSRAPYNNYWGLMKSGGGLQHFATIEDGIKAIDAFLTKAESNGRTTIESFRGWYCASACTNWESTVISTKLKLEALQ